MVLELTLINGGAGSDGDERASSWHPAITGIPTKQARGRRRDDACLMADPHPEKQATGQGFVGGMDLSRGDRHELYYMVIHTYNHTYTHTYMPVIFPL